MDKIYKGRIGREVKDLFTPITENEFGTHPAFTNQHDLNAYLLGGFKEVNLDITDSTTAAFTAATIDGSDYTVDWGDGTVEAFTSGTEASHTYSSPYTGGVKLRNPDNILEWISGSIGWSFTTLKVGEMSSLKKLSLGLTNSFTGAVSSLPASMDYLLLGTGGNITGDVADFAGYSYVGIADANSAITGNLSSLIEGIETFTVYGTNTITGDIAYLPSTLKVSNIKGNNTISGDIANLPPGLEYYRLEGSNTITGDIGQLPATLTYLYITGSNTLFGDLGTYPLSVRSFLILGNTTIDAYTSRLLQDFDLIYINNPTTGLSSSEIDQYLIDASQVNYTAGVTIRIDGAGNARRTAASDSAVATLESKGVQLAGTSMQKSQ